MNSWDGEVGTVRRFLRRRFVHHFPTGSPFGHHPRLRMVCPLRGQWMSTREDSVQLSPRASPPPHPHPPKAASGGGALCLTAGDTRTIVRANPWRSGQITALPSDAGSVALTALREYSSSLLLRKYSILLLRVITLITDMFSISYMQSVTT